MASSESTPYAKSGGLADVVGALPKALARNGCHVTLFHPLYRTVKEEYTLGSPVAADIPLSLGGKRSAFNVFQHRPSPGITTFFIGEDKSFNRMGLYGAEEGDYPDNARRFSLFCRALLATVEHLRLRVDVIHVHDWQTALVPLYLRHRPDFAPSLRNVPSLLTIHNLAYQGLFPAPEIRWADIPEYLFQMEGVEFYGQVNFLKGGILYADAINTVSPSYSREIQTTEHGSGLEGVLQSRRDHLYGILNGADYELWNPGTDAFLPAAYSAENLFGKQECKRTLLRRFGLSPDLNPPLMATISRLVDQKGFDIIVSAMPELLHLGFRYILLGTGEEKYESAFSAMARRHPDLMGVKLAYDESLAHLIEAGADFFLMPSRFEPCGLNQIYSLRYGTIPIVRATGGLDDTVKPYDPTTRRGNGLKFGEYSPEALIRTAREALHLYSRPEHRVAAVRNAMASDFSWDSSAGRYLELYRKLIAVRKSSLVDAGVY
jgi:starch synthase